MGTIRAPTFQRYHEDKIRFWTQPILQSCYTLLSIPSTTWCGKLVFSFFLSEGCSSTFHLSASLCLIHYLSPFTTQLDLLHQAFSDPRNSEWAPSLLCIYSAYTNKNVCCFLQLYVSLETQMFHLCHICIPGTKGLKTCLVTNRKTCSKSLIIK